MAAKDCAGNTCDKRLLQTKEFEQALWPCLHSDGHNKAVTYVMNSLSVLLTSIGQYLSMEPCELSTCRNIWA